jgi:endonuclease/exonuclease/phosphatase family metal-dependent hydrolase
MHFGHGRSDERLDIERQARLLREVGPDVLLLQECDDGTARSGRRFQGDELAKLLSLPYAVAGHEYRYQGGWVGNAIVSRFPLSDVATVIAPQPFTVRALPWRWTKPAGSLVATITVGEKRVTLVTTHFSARSQAYRRAHATHLLEALKQRGPSDMAVIGGDFNSGVGAPEVSAFLSADFQNTRRSDDAVNELTWPIDHIFVSGRGVQIQRYEMLSPGTEASDHEPIYIELNLAPTPVA